MAREQGHNLLPSSHEGLSIQNLIAKVREGTFAGCNLGPPMIFGMRKKILIPQLKMKLKKALDEFLTFAIFFLQLVYFVEPK